MAIPGKCEFTQKTMCGNCRQWQDLRLRSLDWGGDIWLPVICANCGQELANPRQKPQRSKGGLSRRPHIPLLTLPDGSEVVLDEYECSEDDARLFSAVFRDVLQRIPPPARDAILAHWLTDHGSPHIWLLENRRSWGGNGWTASSRAGHSFYMVSTLVGGIPREHVSTAIAHELAHILFVAGGEENHVLSPPENPFNPLPRDPLAAYRREWLVWQLMEPWGFDQPAMEEWMERHTEDDTRAPNSWVAHDEIEPIAYPKRQRGSVGRNPRWRFGLV
jgi:hypothetical protein